MSGIYSSRYKAILLTTVLIAVLFLGLGAGAYGNYMWSLTSHPDASNQYVIDGYKITFLPETHEQFQDRSQGFTVPPQSDDIYIQEGLTRRDTEVMCNHELLHVKGLSPEHHDFIYRNQNLVRSDVCDQLMDVVDSRFVSD